MELYKKQWSIIPINKDLYKSCEQEPVAAFKRDKDFKKLIANACVEKSYYSIILLITDRISKRFL